MMECLRDAEEMIDNMDEMNEGYIDEEKEYESRYKDHIICTKYRVPGLTIDHLKDLDKDGLRN